MEINKSINQGKILGRPKIYDDPLDKVTIRITGSQRDWLESKPDGLGAVIRSLIDQAMRT